MTKVISQLLCFLFIFGILAGCASGPKYQQASESFPQIPSGKGRIYFYRDSSPVGSAIQPDIYMNDQVVGKSKPGGFFYVDRPPGNYVISCSTEAKHKLTIALAANETRYVRTRITMGVFVGQVWPLAEDKPAAMETIYKCSYTPSDY